MKKGLRRDRDANRLQQLRKNADDTLEELYKIDTNDYLEAQNEHKRK